MAWVRKELYDLPFLLVGPILRKVTPTSVSIFLATKEQCSAKIHVYKYDKNTPNNSEKMGSNATPSLFRRIGNNLYVNVVTLNLDTPLERGVLYGYNIEFDDGGNSPFFLVNMATNRIYLQVGTELYPKFKHPTLNDNALTALPTFVLPAEEYEDLRILHASCRKPHGEGPDALEHAVKILISTTQSYLAMPPLPPILEKRPQMLFLTGDQIYADDVSDVLLYMIDKYADLLIGWDENLVPLGYDNSKTAPGKRGHNIVNVAKFSVDEEDAGSHLVKLREFIIMYCMVWSAHLWELDDPDDYSSLKLPDFAQVYPGTQTSNEETIILEGINTPNIQFERKTSEFESYGKQCDRLRFFFKGIRTAIPYILANIPTYMIFDDHEVTDDFLFNGKWFEEAIDGSGLGKRICTSGLAAYSIFQDWGNKPEDYLSGNPGNALLNNIQSLLLFPDNTATWEAISNIVLPELVKTTPPKLAHKSNGNIGSMNWHYYYEVPGKYEFLILDTRTMRVFNNELDGISGLMSDEAINIQVKLPGSNKNKPLTFVIAPTPVIGVNEVENRKLFGKSTILSAETLDFEHWSVDKKAYEGLFAALAKRNYPVVTQPRIILLGGDVHYAYSNVMEYWAKRPYNDQIDTSGMRMKVAALCASSSKNEVSAAEASLGKRLPTKQAYSIYYHTYNLDKPKDISVVYGWGNLDEQKLQIALGTYYFNIPPVPITGPLNHRSKLSPVTFDRNSSYKRTVLFWPTLNEQPNPVEDWHYRINPIKRMDAIPYVPSQVNGYTLDKYDKNLDNHKKLYQKGSKGGEYIVGVNNMGDIKLEVNSGNTIQYVYHQLWWAADDDRKDYLFSSEMNNGLPYTIHQINMEFHIKPKLNE